MRPHARFRSFLAPDIDQFLAHKRSLGRRYDVEQKTLALFDAYLVDSRIGGLHELTPTRVDQFLLSRPRPRPRSYNHLRCTLGRLFSYLVDHEKLTETPLRSAPRRARYQRTPFIFDAEAAKRLLTLAKTLPSKGGTMERGGTYFVLFAVLYGLGLRVGEACRLGIKDVDLERRLLLIRARRSSTRAASCRSALSSKRYSSGTCANARASLQAPPQTTSRYSAYAGDDQSTPVPSVKPSMPWSPGYTWRLRRASRLRACMT